MSDYPNQRIVCDEEAARCRCTKADGHVDRGDPIHLCNPVCGGSWTGTYHGEDFKVVTYPSGRSV